MIAAGEEGRDRASKQSNSTAFDTNRRPHYSLLSSSSDCRPPFKAATPHFTLSAVVYLLSSDDAPARYLVSVLMPRGGGERKFSEKEVGR